MSLGAGRMTLKELINSSESLDLESENLEGMSEEELGLLEERLGRKFSDFETMVERLRLSVSDMPNSFLISAESELHKLRNDLAVVRFVRRSPEHQKQISEIEEAKKLSPEFFNQRIMI